MAATLADCPGAAGQRAILFLLSCILVVLLSIMGHQFIPRYVEQAGGVRDRWTGELCRIEMVRYARCDSGKLLRKEAGRWGCSPAGC